MTSTTPATRDERNTKLDALRSDAQQAVTASRARLSAAVLIPDAEIPADLLEQTQIAIEVGGIWSVVAKLSAAREQDLVSSVLELRPVARKKIDEPAELASTLWGVQVAQSRLNAYREFTAQTTPLVADLEARLHAFGQFMKQAPATA